jgi:hypothetical protein
LDAGVFVVFQTKLRVWQGLVWGDRCVCGGVNARRDEVWFLLLEKCHEVFAFGLALAQLY